MNSKMIPLLLAFALGLVLAYGSPFAHKESMSDETAFARVMRTRTIRCAYASWPPYSIVDANTHKATGIMADLIEEIGRTAHIKIEWTDEVGYGNLADQLHTKKDDVFCSGVRLSAARASRSDITDAVAYAPLYAFVREGDTRFDNNAAAMNDEKISVAVVEGSTIKAVAQKKFPRAQLHSLPEMSSTAEVLLDVATGKADAVFAEELNVADYNAHASGVKLRRIAGLAPLSTMAAVFAVDKGETGLRDFLNAAIEELRSDGTIDRLIAAYAPGPNAILPLAEPYKIAPTP